jgi:hypothetical protein
MTTRSRTALIAATLGAMVMVLVACGALLRFGDPAPDPTPFAVPTTVVPSRGLVHVVGDSITEASRDSIAADLTRRGYDNAVFGLGGSTVMANRGRLLGSIGLKPDVLVVELGHNDAGGLANPEVYPTAADREAQYIKSVLLMSATIEDAAEVPCVLWLNVSDWTRLPTYDTTDYGARFNRDLQLATDSADNAHLVDYASLFRPTSPERDGYLRANFDEMLLHPDTDDAKNKFVDLIGRSVDEVCALPSA